MMSKEMILQEEKEHATDPDWGINYSTSGQCYEVSVGVGGLGVFYETTNTLSQAWAIRDKFWQRIKEDYGVIPAPIPAADFDTVEEEVDEVLRSARFTSHEEWVRVVNLIDSCFNRGRGDE